MFRRSGKPESLRSRLGRALKAERLDEALELYELIEKQIPDEPRWAHRRGDLLQRMGRKADAVVAYERAVELYAAKGFVARAVAMAKLILAMDPRRGEEVLERVDPRAARRLHRENRAVIVTADEASVEEPDGPPTDTQSLITDALPLITDRTAPQGETRFTESKRTDGVRLDVTPIELLDRPIPRESLISQRPSASMLAQLPSTPLFAEVPEQILRVLIRESALVDIEDGQQMTTRGMGADALFVIVEGNAVGRRGRDHQTLLLGEGDLAGVACLLSNVAYTEDVVACGRVRALRITKILLDRLVHEHPPVGDVLLEVLGRRLISTLLRTSPIFTAFDDATRRSIAQLFEVRRARAGTRLVEAGKRSDGMYLPLHGRVIVRAANGRRLGRMDLGRAIGQDSLLTREPCRMTIEAGTDVLVLRMPVPQFSKLLMTRPDIVQRFQMLHRAG